MTRARAAALLAAALLGPTGCPFHPRAPTPGTNQGDWAQRRDGASRRYELYDGLVHRASATATYLSPEVREARARRLASWLSWTDAELTQRLADERAEAAAVDDFVIVFYTADRHDNDLDGLRSVWRVAVLVGSLEVLPTEIRALDDDATVRTLYPWIGPFDTVYRARFPHPPDGALAARPFVLRISSALGALPLDYGAPAQPIEIPSQAP